MFIINVNYNIGEGCEELTCTGWGQWNPQYGLCTDGFEECSCKDLPITEEIIPKVIPKSQCYCPLYNQTEGVTTTTTTMEPCEGKKCPKTKTKTGTNEGLGYGDCICDKNYGQTTLTVKYEGIYNISIFYSVCF